MTKPVAQLTLIFKSFIEWTDVVVSKSRDYKTLEDEIKTHLEKEKQPYFSEKIMSELLSAFETKKKVVQSPHKKYYENVQALCIEFNKLFNFFQKEDYAFSLDELGRIAGNIQGLCSKLVGQIKSKSKPDAREQNFKKLLSTISEEAALLPKINYLDMEVEENFVVQNNTVPINMSAKKILALLQDADDYSEDEEGYSENESDYRDTATKQTSSRNLLTLTPKSSAKAEELQMKHFSADVERLEKEKKELLIKIEEHTKIINELERAHKEQKERAEKSNSIAKEWIEYAKKGENSFQEQKSKLEIEISHLHLQLDTLKQNLDKIEQEKKELLTKLEEQEKKVQFLNISKQEQEQEIVKLKETNSSINKLWEESKFTLSTLLAEKQTAQEHSKTEKYQYEEKVQTLNIKLTQIESGNKLLIKEINELKEQKNATRLSSLEQKNVPVAENKSSFFVKGLIFGTGLALGGVITLACTKSS